MVVQCLRVHIPDGMMETGVRAVASVCYVSHHVHCHAVAGEGHHTGVGVTGNSELRAALNYAKQ